MSLQKAYMIYVESESLKKWNNYFNLKVNIHKRSCVCNKMYSGETRRNARISWDESQNQPNISETTLTIHFPGNFNFLNQLIITSEKS